MADPASHPETGVEVDTRVWRWTRVLSTRQTQRMEGYECEASLGYTMSSFGKQSQQTQPPTPPPGTAEADYVGLGQPGTTP